MALTEMLKASRDKFQSHLQVVKATFANQPIYLQPARESLRAAFNAELRAAFASDLKPIAGSAGSVSERLTRLAAAHAKQQPILQTVFPDPVERDDVLKDALSALQDAFQSVLS